MQLDDKLATSKTVRISAIATRGGHASITLLLLMARCTSHISHI